MSRRVIGGTPRAARREARAAHALARAAARRGDDRLAVDLKAAATWWRDRAEALKAAALKGGA